MPGAPGAARTRDLLRIVRCARETHVEVDEASNFIRALASLAWPVLALVVVLFGRRSQISFRPECIGSRRGRSKLSGIVSSQKQRPNLISQECLRRRPLSGR